MCEIVKEIDKASRDKRHKRSIVFYSVVCSICHEKITSLYVNKLMANYRNHILKHTFAEL